MTEPVALVGRRLVAHEPTGFQRVAAVMVGLAIRAVAATCRFEILDPHGAVVLAHKGPVIFATWHNRLAFSVIIHRRVFRSGKGGRGLAALVSASRDGALLAAILRFFGVVPVRGSSSRRGAQALVELRKWSRQGLHLAVTPDGPRGPCYRAQAGALALARAIGCPLIPVSLNTRWRVDLKSWDRFQVPLPFGRCRIEVGEPMVIEAKGDDALEAARQVLEARLLAMTRD